MKKKSVLITGGAGFIGSHLANRLTSEGFKVLVIDNLSKGKQDYLNSKVDFLKQDITSKKFKNTLVKYQPDMLFHFAAQSSLKNSLKDPKKELKVNFLPILEITDALKFSKSTKIIFASSAAVYGKLLTKKAKETHKKEPLSPYGISKLATENYIKYFCTRAKIPYLILRFANVYGPKQNSTSEGGVVAIFATNMLKGKKVVIYGDGNQTRDFIFVDDVVEANLKGLTQKIIGEFNVSTKKETSINNLFGTIAASIKYKNKPSYLTKGIFDVERSVMDNSSYFRKAKWRPKTSLRQGLRKTISHFKTK